LVQGVGKPEHFRGRRDDEHRHRPAGFIADLNRPGAVARLAPQVAGHVLCLLLGGRVVRQFQAIGIGADALAVGEMEIVARHGRLA
jgi:hypothetical protein